MPEKDLSASLEDYLEAIYHFTQEKSFAQANQVAQALGVGKSSVTWALNQLQQKGLINHAPYEAITLTDTGRLLAQKVVRSHEGIKRFLMQVLAVPEDMAQENACRMEHVIEREIMERMGRFTEIILACPRTECVEKLKACTRPERD